MPISEYEDDSSVYRDQVYADLRSSFIDDNGDSTFATDDASTADAPDVSVWQGMLWALATMLGHCEEQIQRAGNNRNPALAKELLAVLERDHLVVPAYGSTISERQATLALRARVAQGASRPAIEAALTELLGADFVAYETNDDVAEIQTWPASPGDVGVFDFDTVERKTFRILDPISITGSPQTVDFEVIGESNPPQDGEVYCFDPSARSPNIERVTITSVLGSTLTATFTKPHQPNTVACRPHPVWLSTQRTNRVVLTLAAATDTTIRQKVNDYLSRTLRGVSQWSICSDEGTFLLGDATRGILGATALSATAEGGTGGSAMGAGFAGAVSSAAAVGSSVLAGAAAGAAAATGTATAVSAPTKESAGAAAGTATATATSNAQKRSAGASATTATVLGKS